MLLFQLVIVFILGYIIREQVDALLYEIGYVNLYKHGRATIITGEHVHTTKAIAMSRIEENPLEFIGTHKVKIRKNLIDE
jgi:hypothetical protein